jgi:UPF0755 protein
MTRLLLVCGLVMVSLAAGTLLLTHRFLNQPMNLPSAGHLLEVQPGTSLRTLSNRLGAQGVLGYPWILTSYGRLTGMAAELKAGEYEIPAGTTPLALLQQLVEGRVKLHSLTIVEGWTMRDVMRAIRNNLAIRQTLGNMDGEALTRALNLPSPQPEGWFFPDTYRFPRHTTDREILGMAYARMAMVLEQAWAGRQLDLPLRNAYDALILASIVEKETGLDRERVQVAGVLIRRLKSGMKLQTDPTVIYGLGEEFDGDLTRRQLAKDTPYNTYTRSGLPPTPISLPSESSLLAAVHPDKSESLYFVASGDDDGSHVFSATLRAHNAAVRRFLEATRGEGK